MEDAVECELLAAVVRGHLRLAARCGGAVARCCWLALDTTLALLLRPEAALLLILGLLAALSDPRRTAQLRRRIAAATAGWWSVAGEAGGARSMPEAAAVEAPQLWRGRHAVAYAVQGLRPSMEDRFSAEEDIEIAGAGSDRDIYAVYDGHGGDFAAEYVRRHLLCAVKRRLAEAYASSTRETTDTVSCSSSSASSVEPVEPTGHTDQTLLDGESAVVNGGAETDDATAAPSKRGASSGRLLDDVYSGATCKRRRRGIGGAVGGGGDDVPTSTVDSVVSPLGRIDYTALMEQVFCSVDVALLERARRTASIAGTTAVLALRDGQRLVLAGCGDSRAVMCDAQGRAVPLTVDHKPDLAAERRRIMDAGGFVALNGVWRVNGVLACSRALGDLPFKQRHLLTCLPDVTCVDIGGSTGQFVLLATDGLWDVVSCDEAVQHVRARWQLEADRGMASLTALALHRGSTDNVTVLVAELRPAGRQLHARTADVGGVGAPQ